MSSSEAHQPSPAFLLALVAITSSVSQTEIRNVINENIVPSYTVCCIFFLCYRVVSRFQIPEWVLSFNVQAVLSKDRSVVAIPPAPVTVPEPKAEEPKVTTEAAPVAPIQVEDESKAEEQFVDLTGSFKLVKNENFQGFLAAQGVSWALRQAADKAVTVHHMTHTGNTLRIQVSGIISGDTTFIIGGPPVETKIRDRVFHDHVTYCDNGKGVKNTKVGQTDNYNVIVVRALTEDKSHLIITSTVAFPDGKEATAVQTYQRVS